MKATLSDLLISQEQLAFLRNAEALVATADNDRLGRWWVKMNERYWPDDIDDPIPLRFHPDWRGMQCRWAQDEVFRLIAAKLSVETQTLYWRAAGHASEQKVRAARTELEYRRQASAIKVNIAAREAVERT